MRTRQQCEAVTDSDLPAAMGWLDVKPIAGDTALISATATSILERWRRAVRKRLPELLNSARKRLDEFGRLAYLNQPDIKEARGGLRDSVTRRTYGPYIGRDASCSLSSIRSSMMPRFSKS